MVMAEETAGSKWEGKATAEVRGIPAEQVWSLFQDFCNVHKWLPSIDTCRHVQGVYGEPGLVRYCASTVSVPSPDDDVKQTPTTAVVYWCNEKLVSMDQMERRLSYEIAENNMGFTSYVAEWKVSETEGGCRIEWRFTADPVEGWGVEDLSGIVESSVKGMAGRIEKELQLQAAAST